MIRLLTVTVGALVGLSSPLAGQETEFAPALPRDGASLTISNELVDVWDVRWIVDVPTPMHRHEYDYLGVELTSSETLLTAADGSTRVATLERGRVWFLPKGVTHSETGLTDDPPRHAIMVELTGDPPSAVPNGTDLPSGPVAEGVEPVVDNERVSIWDVVWSGEQAEGTRFYSLPVVLMFMDDAELAWSDAAGESGGRTYQEGEAMFIPAGETRSIRSLGGPVRVVVVELKEGG